MLQPLPPQIILNLMNQARALQSAGNAAQARELFERILAADPDHVDALHFCGIAVQSLGDVSRATALIARAVELRPDSAILHNNLAEMLRIQGRIDEAVASYRRAITLSPNSPVLLVHLGTTLQAQGKLEEARELFQRSVALAPTSAEPLCNLAENLRMYGDLDGAVATLRKAVSIQPNSFEAMASLGIALRETRRSSEAAGILRRALTLRPDVIEVLINLGAALLDLGLCDQATECCERALGLDPNRLEAWNLIALTRLLEGRLDESIDAYREAVRIKPDLPETRSNLLLALNYHPAIQRASIFAEHVEWAKAHTLGDVDPLPYANARDPDRALRIGYVSGDFKEHAAAYFIEPVLQAHARDGSAEIFCYSNAQSPDEGTRRMQSLCHRWREIARISDEEALRMIRADAIDILVDLSGHTAHNRLGVFARKPAPVQLTWIGYPNTTGLATMDYWITDAYIDPRGQTGAYCTEQLVRLPETFACYRPPREAPEIAEPPADRNGFVTFGSFNMLAKLGDGVLEMWSRILSLVPGARLLIATPRLRGGQGLASIKARCSRAGLSADRVKFIDGESLAGYLKRHNEIDIALDSFPFTGHTVTLHALWMGVPVVTLAGNTHVSRRGVSIMSNIGLPELIARTPDDYIHIAVELAGDLGRLAELRSGMRPRMGASPIMDSDRLLRNLMSAYRETWRKWCAS